jgi:SSS family solute:Na+ symporter
VAWRRINGVGAMASLIVGFVLGTARLVLELIHGPEQEGLAAGSVWATIAEVNFLHIAIILFVICVVVLVGVSLATAVPAPERVAGLTFATADEPVVGGEAEERPERVERPGWRRVDLALTGVLLVIVAALWIVFS